VNEQAQQAIARAKEFLATGDEKYRLAAKEMRAARDAGATWDEIGDGVGRSESWCRKVVTWAELPANERSNSTVWENHKDIDRRKARQVIREEPEVVLQAIQNDPELAQAIAKDPEAVAAVAAAGVETELAGITVGAATQSPELQIKRAATKAKHERMQEISTGIRVIASMDVEEYVSHSNWEFESDHSPSLRMVGRDLDAAIDNLQKLRNRITARLLKIG
jgi:hypothetical protein